MQINPACGLPLTRVYVVHTTDGRKVTGDHIFPVITDNYVPTVCAEAGKRSARRKKQKKEREREERHIIV